MAQSAIPRLFPLPGDLITKDLAQACVRRTVAAEYIKIHYGAAIPTMDGLDEMIEVPSVGDRQSRQISRRVLAEIIGPRVEEILGIDAERIAPFRLP